MTLTDLRYLVALAHERHFGRAAEKCHVSQPTLSVAVKKVEDELGIQLFERSASEVKITETGQRIVLQAEKVLMEAVRRGGDRQALHEVLREHALTAWPEGKAGRPNPLPGLLAADPRLTAQLAPHRILELLDARTHVGDAPVRAREMADHLRAELHRLQEMTPC